MAAGDKPQREEQIVEGADSEEEIRQRAYEISQSDDAGTPEEDWHRAAREVEQRNTASPT
jgi:hypothetical protein